MTLKELTQGYANLLAFEYRGRSNADRQMNLYAKQFVGDFLAQSLSTCFILDTAVGVQLDTLGKYIGVPRNIGTPNDTAYFGLWTYGSALDPTKYQGTWVPTTDVPTVPAAAPGNTGYWYVAYDSGVSTSPIAETFLAGDILVSDGTTWSKQTDDNGNGLTTYTNLMANREGIFYRYQFNETSNTSLSDTDYRQVLKLQVIRNSSDHTLYSIQNALHQVYPGVISLTDNADMTMDYAVSSEFPLSRTLLGEYLPRPMAVGINVEIVAPPAMGVEMECRTKSGTTTAVGFVGPTDVRFRRRTVAGSLVMKKLFSGTTCTPSYQGAGTGIMTAVPAFYFVNQYYDCTVTIILNEVIGSTAYYTLSGVTCVPAAGYPVYGVPAFYPMVGSAIRSIGYTFDLPVGTVFTAGIAITAIYGYGIGAVNYQAGVFQYTDTWNIVETVEDDGSITIISDITTRNENGVPVTPIPGRQGQVPPSGMLDVAAGRPDLFYVPWSTGFVQMEPTYAAVTSGESWRLTTGLGCIVGTGFGPTRMSAEGNVRENFRGEWTTEQEIVAASVPLTWVAGCDTPSTIEPHAVGDTFAFTTGQVRFVAGTTSPLTVGTAYQVTITFVRRVRGTADPFVSYSTQVVNFVASVSIYTSDWINVPNEEGFDTKMGSATFAIHNTLAYALTSGGDTLSTSTGDRLVLLP